MLIIIGKILIYVWAYEQERKFTTQDVFVPWHLHNTYDQTEKSEKETLTKEVDIEQNTGFIETAIKDESKKSTIYHRYYHVFKKGELEELIEQIDGLEIERSFYDHANWCVILLKTQ